jgi:hypothetical protein
MMAKKPKSDDEIFAAAKTKLGALIAKSESAGEVVSLVNSLVKMKAVELKMGEDDWGSGLNTPEDGDGK